MVTVRWTSTDGVMRTGPLSEEAAAKVAAAILGVTPESDVEIIDEDDFFEKED